MHQLDAAAAIRFTPAMSKFKISDRVRLKGHQRIFIVVEVAPPGCEPLAPSTYTLRLALPPDMKPDHWLYGDAVLEPAGE